MSFSMQVSSPEEIKAAVEEQTKPVPEEEKKLQELAAANVATIMDLNLDSLEKRREILQSIESFGADTMTRSAEKNNLLRISVGNLSKSGDEGGVVAKSLTDLHRQMKDLDPSVIDFTKTGFLGRFFNPLRAYFARFETAEGIIADVITTMDKGKATLKNDNTTMEIEQQQMRELTKILKKEIQLGILMDEEIERQIESAKNRGEDPEKIKFITDEVLFPLRQRIIDMQKSLAVNQQGIMAMELVIRNNKELIRGADRAKIVTIPALRTAAMVAGALYNQKILLKKLELLQATTDGLISGTARMLKEQGAEIHKQALESGLSVDLLKQAFSDVFEAYEAISTFKQEALPKMKEMVSQFKDLAEGGEQTIVRMEQGNRIALP